MLSDHNGNAKRLCSRVIWGVAKHTLLATPFICPVTTCKFFYFSLLRKSSVPMTNTSDNKPSTMAAL